MNWIIYSLINFMIFLLMGLALLLLAFAVPAVIALCMFGMALSFLREQKQKLGSAKKPIGRIQIIKFSDIMYGLTNGFRDHISRVISMSRELHLRPIFFQHLSHHINSSATLAPRNRHPVTK